MPQTDEHQLSDEPMRIAFSKLSSVLQRFSLGQLLGWFVYCAAFFAILGSYSAFFESLVEQKPPPGSRVSVLALAAFVFRTATTLRGPDNSHGAGCAPCDCRCAGVGRWICEHSWPADGGALEFIGAQLSDFAYQVIRAVASARIISVGLPDLQLRK
jgi:hypothetical protein